MKSLPRGLAAASVASLAVHLAAFALPWRGVQGSAPHPAAVSTLVARVIEAPSRHEPAPSSATPAAAELEPVPLPVTSAAPAVSALADAAVVTSTAAPIAPAQAIVSPPMPFEAPPPVAASASAADRGPDRAGPADPTATARSGGDSRAAGLDRGPRPLDDIEPVFPAAAGHRGGTVTLRLIISDKGEVESIAVVHAVPPGLFDEAALAAFGRARFSPGLRGGVPVRSEVLYEVEFAPLGKGTDSSGRTY